MREVAVQSAVRLPKGGRRAGVVTGLSPLEQNAQRVRSLAGFGWIRSIRSQPRRTNPILQLQLRGRYSEEQGVARCGGCRSEAEPCGPVGQPVGGGGWARCRPLSANSNHDNGCRPTGAGGAARSSARTAGCGPNRGVNAGPSGIPPRLGRAAGPAEAARDARQAHGLAHGTGPTGILLVDPTGFLKTGDTPAPAGRGSTTGRPAASGTAGAACVSPPLPRRAARFWIALWTWPAAGAGEPASPGRPPECPARFGLRPSRP